MVVNDVKQRKTATSTFYVFILFFYSLPAQLLQFCSVCIPLSTKCHFKAILFVQLFTVVPYFISKSCHLLLEDDTSAPWHRKDSAKYFSPSELDGRFIWNFEAALSESVSVVLE